MCPFIFLSCAHSLLWRSVSILVFQATNLHNIKLHNINTMRGNPLCDLICDVIVDNTPPTFRVPICTLGFEVWKCESLSVHSVYRTQCTDRDVTGNNTCIIILSKHIIFDNVNNCCCGWLWAIAFTKFGISFKVAISVYLRDCLRNWCLLIGNCLDWFRRL